MTSDDGEIACDVGILYSAGAGYESRPFSIMTINNLRSTMVTSGSTSPENGRNKSNEFSVN